MRPIDADALLNGGIRVSHGFNDNGLVMLPMGDVRRSIQNAPTLDIYLIYSDDADDCCQIKGYFIGTEEEADLYVEALDKSDPIYNGWTWERLEKLN